MKAIVSRYKLNKMLLWCVYKYGMTEQQDDYPEFILHRSQQYMLKRYIPPDPEDLFFIKKIKGEYDYSDNTIHIYSWANKDLEDFCQTMIHEYQHYLEKDQDSEVINNRKSIRLDKLAETIAQRDYLECLKHLGYR